MSAASALPQPCDQAESPSTPPQSKTGISSQRPASAVQSSREPPYTFPVQNQAQQLAAYPQPATHGENPGTPSESKTKLRNRRTTPAHREVAQPDAAAAPTQTGGDDGGCSAGDGPMGALLALSVLLGLRRRRD